VIDLNEFYKYAEFLGKLGIELSYAGKTSTKQAYQQSYPQYLGVSSLLYKNQGLSAGSRFDLCRWCASAQKQAGANHASAAMA
jgi:hypothetical protein